MEIGKVIGVGRYRECLEIVGTDLCIKRPKERLTKKILGMEFSFNMAIYILLKFFTADFNEKEYWILCDMPESLKDYLPGRVEFIDSRLLLERPKDYDGRYSRTVEKTGRITNEKFWQQVDRIASILMENKLFLMDVFHLGNNVVVQKISQTDWRPVLIDVKRLGYYTYPFQFHLVLKSQQKRKFLRRLRKFKSLYCSL